MPQSLVMTIMIMIVWGNSAQINCQTNYEPADNFVYSFLERISIKGLIQLNEEIKPFSRAYIADKLLEISERIEKLSALEKKELVFYIREYTPELKRVNFQLEPYLAKNRYLDFFPDVIGFNEFNRYRFVNYTSSNFNFFLEPILYYSQEYQDGSSSVLWASGLKSFGSLGSHLGFGVEFYDNHYRGDYFDGRREFSELTGYEFIVGKQGGLDFDRMNAYLSYSDKSITFTIGKDFNYYGSGELGKIILSDKSPSFPFFKLEVNPADWIKFSYIHGLLNSRLIDSSGIRLGELRHHYPKVTKYYVTHIISFTPYPFLNFSLGESVIYSDRFEPIYLIPVAFFRMADHYLTDPDESAGNAQLFSTFWFKWNTIRTKFYSSVLLDELSTSEIDSVRAIAINIGFKAIDPLIPESELILEFTRIDPFVYFHQQRAQTYANYGYSLGHWIGGNADQVYASFSKRFLRGLTAGISYLSVRKGSEGNYNEKPYQPKHTFLWGLKRYLNRYKLSVSYELIHTLFARLDYWYTVEEIEKSASTFTKTDKSYFSFSLSYGL